MKKKLSIILIIILAIILGCVFYYKDVTSKPLKGEVATVEVESGDSFYKVLNKLDKQGMLKNRSLLGIHVKLSGVKTNIVPGVFEIPGDAKLEEMIEILGQSTNEGITVTIPEGYDIERMADLFEEKGMFTKSEFIDAVKAYPLPSYIPESSERRYDLEGFLFPDTYFFDKDAKPASVVGTMFKTFESKVKPLVEDENDIYEIVTKASIIEGETRVDEERPIVASVINNRLNIDMMLQIDATVIYALGEHVSTVLYEHLNVDSPYNTYKNYGLPVGPICSPGLASIKAAINPADTNYLYYVLETEDHHYFTDNYTDFENKKRELGY